MSVIVFDIDGTLTQSSDVDSELYRIALKEVLGPVPIYEDWLQYDHVTDSGILAQVMRENGIANQEATAARVRQYFGELHAQRLRERPCPAVDGALNAIEELQSDGKYRIGLATGGWGHTARMKLEAAGFEIDGIPLFSADDEYRRTGIMKLCKEAVAPEASRVVYFGDGFWDVNAARELGWHLIGVGPRLRDEVNPWIPDFTGDGWREALARVFA